MSTALIYWQSMNGSGASNGLESSPATHLASHLAAPAAVSAVDWHYSTPAAAAAAAAMQQRPPYARNWSAESNSTSSNSGQHYLAQIGCQHSVKNLVNGFVNASSKFKATAKHNDPVDKNYNCKLYKGCGIISMHIYLNVAKAKGSYSSEGAWLLAVSIRVRGQLLPKDFNIIDFKCFILSFESCWKLLSRACCLTIYM